MDSDSAARIAGRLERLPATRGFWRRVNLLSLGGFFEFYDLFMAAYIQPGLVKAGIITTTTRGLFSIGGFAGFVAFFFLGLFVGTALFGFVADRLGRRTRIGELSLPLVNMHRSRRLHSALRRYSKCLHGIRAKKGLQVPF